MSPDYAYRRLLPAKLIHSQDPREKRYKSATLLCTISES